LVDVGHDVVLIQQVYHAGTIYEGFGHVLSVYLLYFKLANE